MFAKAERKKAKLRLGMCGPSGSGKTWSALEISKGMGGKIALLDTERRGHLYAEDFIYDISELDAPYSPERYISAIKEAEKANYDILIIDSLSHAWVGEGGVLSIVDRAGGTFQQGWKTATPKQNALVDAIVTSKLHIIVTMRSKTEYVVEPNEKGKMAPRKVGLAPVQRDGLEYEFTMFMDLNQEHFAHVTKDNTKLFDQQYIKPSEEMGKNLMEWLKEGKTVEEIYAIQIEEVKIDFESSNDVPQLVSKYNNYLTKFPTISEQIKSMASQKKLQLNRNGEVH